MLRDSSNKGQILMESMIGISVATVGLLSVVVLLTRSVSLTKDVAQKFVATYLAAEGVEVVKNIIDENFVRKFDDNESIPWNEGVMAGSYEVDYTTQDMQSRALGLGGESSTPLKFNSLTGMYSYAAGDDSMFKRTIVITEENIDGKSGTDAVKVFGIVKWRAHGIDQEVVLEDHFFEWRTK